MHEASSAVRTAQGKMVRTGLRPFAHPSVTGLSVKHFFAIVHLNWSVLSGSVLCLHHPSPGARFCTGSAQGPPPDGILRGTGRPIYSRVVDCRLGAQRSDLVRRPGEGLRIGRAWVSTLPKPVDLLGHAAAALNGLPSASMRCMITASLRASATLALLMPARLAIRIAQLLSLEQPLIGRVRMTWAAS
jgi:hypothetical protein